jgi:hypothetical protein
VLVIDVGVDTAWVRERIREREGEAALTNLDPGWLMRLAAVAEAYWQIFQEPLIEDAAVAPQGKGNQLNFRPVLRHWPPWQHGSPAET